MSGRRHRDADRGQDLPRLEGGGIGALIELARADAALAALAGDVIGRAQAQHYGRHIVAGIAVGDISSERADVAHLRIGDQQRGLAQDRNFLREQIRGGDLVLRGHGPDDDVGAVGSHALELRHAGQIDEVVGGGKAKLHHRDQAVSASDGERVLAELGKQRDRVVDRCRAMVGERSRDHDRSSPRRALGCGNTAAAGRRYLF